MKIIYFVLILLISLNTHAKECKITKATFDIGSGTSKMVVAIVDQCQHKIIKILKEDSKAIAFKADLEQNILHSQKHEFSEQILQVAMKNFDELYNEANKFKPSQYIGIATEAFRSANNSTKFFSELKKKFHIKVKIIEQAEERKLGVKTIQNITADKNIIVWDIGGASMQITSIGDKLTQRTFDGKLASVNFKNLVIETIKGDDAKTIYSPNSIGVQNVQKTIKLSENLARILIDKELIEIAPHKKVFGIGGVLGISIPEQIKNSDSITTEAIEAALNNNSKLKDNEIGGKYYETQVTNLALVLGHMKAMGIKEYTPIRVNLAHALLLN